MISFNTMTASQPGPFVVMDFVCYEDAPLTYLFAGAIAADSEQQFKARDWYLLRIKQLVNSKDEQR